MMVLLILLLLLSHPSFAVREAVRVVVPLALPLCVSLFHRVEADPATPGARRFVTLLLDRYYQDHADRLSFLHRDLPPIDWMTRIINDDNDIWMMMNCRIQQADCLFGWQLRDHYRWIPLNRPGCWGHSAPLSARVAATRLWVRDRIAQRLPVVPMLTAMREEGRRRAWSWLGLCQYP